MITIIKLSSITFQRVSDGGIGLSELISAIVRLGRDKLSRSILRNSLESKLARKSSKVKGQENIRVEGDVKGMRAYGVKEDMENLRL